MSRVFWWYSSENLSPRVRPDFLTLQQELLMPGQFAREHQNQWIEGADSFTSAADVDAAMGMGWVERLWACPEPDHAMAVDLGYIGDPAVVGAAHLTDGVLYVCRLITIQGSREAPVRMSAIKETIRALHANRQTVTTKIESWQGISIAQDLQQELPGVELFVPTAKAHAEQWPLLAHRLSNRTLILPRHLQLREELLGLSYEVGPMGVKVTDRTAVHQDHAVVVRMLVAALADAGSGLWWQRSNGILVIGRGRAPVPAAAPFATPARSLEAEARQQAEDDEEKRQRAGLAAAALSAELQKKAEADRLADIEEGRRLDEADRRRMNRWTGSHWSSWR